MKLLTFCAAVVLWLYPNMYGQENISEVYTLTNYDKLNTYFSDYNLTKYTDNSYLLISNRGMKDSNKIWKGGGELELYTIELGDVITYTQLPIEINEQYSNGTIAVQNPNLIYFSASKKTAKMDPVTGDFIYREYLCKAEKVNGSWVVNLMPEFSNKQYSYKNPAISEFGNLMYFSSDIPGGFGGFDLYMCYLEDGKWSIPKNLGKDINTKSDEINPFLHKSGDLYFASDGHITFGGQDIYQTMLMGDKWTPAKNLGQALNSSGNEVSIYFDESKESGYLSSDKRGGKGKTDIYFFSSFETTVAQ